MSKVVINIIPTLCMGGAERQLYNLVSNDYNNTHYVVTLFRSKCLFGDINHLYFFSFSFFKLLLNNRSGNVSLVFWMYHCCLLSIFFRFFFSNISWNIRRSGVSLSDMKIITFIISRILIPFSYFVPRNIIYCAQSALVAHSDIHYSTKNAIYIANGIDNKNYKKKYYHVRPISILFVGRNVPEKNFEHFLSLVNFIREKNSSCLFIFTVVGRGYNHYSSLDYINFIDQTSDMTSIYSSHDIIISTSITEGFPNVIAEAMLFGCIPYVTNAGDSFDLVQNYGYKISNNTTLDEIYDSILNTDFNTFPYSNIQYYIKSNFSIDIMVKNYSKVLFN